MRHCLTLLLYVTVFAISASAQADVATATLSGVVMDPSGAVIANASVAASSIEKGTTREIRTGDIGAYRIPLLDPGAYQVRFEAPGFTTRIFDQVVLRVGDTFVLDAQLDIPGLTQESEVTTSGLAVDTERTQESNTITLRQVASLPNLGRDFTPYVLILPGVSDPEAARAQNPGMAWPTTGFAVGGGSGHANLLTVDGGEHEYGTGVFRTPVNVETIQEFQVNRNAFLAEFGFTAGSAVNLVTRSGSNTVHGSGYGYYRSNKLAARNYFDPPGLTPFSQTVTGGGTLGGPLVRNRLFGFVAYEGWKADRARSTPYLDNVEVYGPTANPQASVTLRTQQTYLNQLAASSDSNLQRIGATLRQTLTATNFPVTMQLLRDNSTAWTAKDRRHYWMGRADYYPSNRDTITGRLTGFHSTTDASFTVDNPLSAPSDGSVIYAPDFAFLGTWSHVFSSSSVNQTRVQVARNNSSIQSNSPDSTEIDIDGVASFGRQFALPFSIFQKRYQFEDVFTTYRRGHTIKAGASYRPVDYRVRNDLWFGGDWTFSTGIYPLLLAVQAQDQPALVQFNLTTIDPSTGSAYPVTGPALAGLSGLQSFNLGLPFLFHQGFNNPIWAGWANDLGSFVQDSWAPSKRINLDYGLRYDYFGEPSPLHHHGYASPRLGAAWNVRGDGRTVIRAGGGLFYAPAVVQVPYFGALLDDSGRYINQIFKTPLAGAQSPAALWAVGLATGKLPNRALTETDLRGLGVQTGKGAPGRVIFEVDPGYQNSYTVQASAGVSQQLAADLSLEVSYLTYHGRHLGLSQEANYRESGQVDPLLGPMYVPIDPTITERNVARSIGSSAYQGMTVSLSKLYRRNYEFQVNYTLSHTEDDVTDTDAALSAFMPTRLNREWGRSVYDVPHTLVANMIMQTPDGRGHGALLRALGGMTLAPVLRARSGTPFTLLIGRDVNGDTHANDRPFLADRNTGRGPAFWTLDMRVSREFPFGDSGLRAELTAEASNLANHTNFISVNNIIGTDPQYLKGPFNLEGRQDVSRFSLLGFNAAAPGRQVQFGLRLHF